tara:strand:+ start:1137 stop:1442 length:306 start_codon:yes stop_codon:yes gene_type:complete
MDTNRKNIAPELNKIHDEIRNNKIIHLYRIRQTDLAKHEFIFQKITTGEEPYLTTEKFENETVSDEYHDHETILILCRWLLQLNFTLKIYKIGDFPTEKIN